MCSPLSQRKQSFDLKRGLSRRMADLISGDDVTVVSSTPNRAPIVGRLRADGARQAMDYTPPVRAGAFKAAGRHTARVKFLKRAIVLGSLLALSGTALVAVFNPFRHLPSGVSLSGVGVSGTKITMNSPKISGVQQGGGPYEIKSKAGVQDITRPSIIELEGVDAKVGMADATVSHITAATGVYDSRADKVTLKGDVKIVNASNYTLKLQSAAIDFRAGILASHERLKVEIPGGAVFADDMTIANQGHVISLRGNVSSSFETAEESRDTDTAQAEAR